MDLSYSFLFIVCLAGRGLGQSIINPPSPATSLLGETATFSCEIDMVASTYFEWYFKGALIYWYDNGGEDYPTEGGREKYSVELSGQVFTLTVSNLVFADGGLYGCKVLRADAVNVALLVLEAPSVGPTTPNTVESSISTFSCEAYFGGPARTNIVLNHYPKLRMFLRGNLLEGLITEKFPEGPITYYVISMETNVTLEAAMNGEAITCEIYTDNPSGSVTGSHDMIVQYSVRGTDYMPRQETFSIGSIISCFANGNPEPTFEWRNTAGEGGSISTRNMTITEEMVGMNTWECQADNTVDGTPHSETVQATFTVLEATDPGEVGPGSDSWKIAVGVAVPICVIIIGAIAALVVYTFVLKKKKAAKPPNSNAPMNNSMDGSNKGKFENPGYKGSLDGLESYPDVKIHQPDRYQNAPNLPFNGNVTPPPNYAYQTNLLGTGIGSQHSLPLDDGTPEAVYTKPIPANRTRSQEYLERPPHESHVSFDKSARDNSDSDGDSDQDSYDMPTTPPPPLSHNDTPNQFRPAQMPARLPTPDTQV